jgi:YVTN family beta-propeller protein
VGIEGQTNAHIGGYQLGEVIGRGGMGVVYKATHVHLGRQVALKLLAPELSGNDEFRRRFLRESRLAASIEHPNVIPVYDAGDSQGTLYIAMRYVDGVDLARFLRDQGPLEPLMALSLLDQVAAALDAAHDHDLIHRDVKPANVMIAAGRCYLTDFGLTKQASAAGAESALTRTGSFLGTLNYTAPEQIEGKQITASADLYALGCVMHECLTGAPPFTKDSEVALLYAHLSEPPPPPSRVRPGLPPAIDGVMAKALAKSPEERYRTCGEFMAAARAALTQESGSGVAARPAPPTVAAGTPTVAAPPPALAPTLAPHAGDTRVGGPGEPGPPGRRGSRRGTLLAVGAAILAAAVVGVVVSSGGGSGKPSRQATSSGRTGRSAGGGAVIKGAIPVGNSPDAFASDPPTAHDQNAGTLWTANAGDGTITAISMQSKSVIGTFSYTSDFPNPAAPMVYWQGHLWVGDSKAGTVVELNPSTGAKVGPAIHVGGDPHSITIMPPKPGTLWVANLNDTIARIDAGSIQPAIIHGLASGPKRMAQNPAGTRLWIANANDGTVTEIDANADQILGTANVVGNPVAINYSEADQKLWVADGSAGTVTRYTPVSPTQLTKFESSIRVGRGPKRLVSTNCCIWVADSGDGTVTLINARSGSVMPKITVGGYPGAISVSDLYMWVALWSQPTIPLHAPFPPGGVKRLELSSL